MPIDYTDEDLAARWEEFFESSENRVRVAEVADLYPEVRSINIAYAELDQFDPDMAQFMLEEPQRVLSIGEAVVRKQVQQTRGNYKIHLRFKALAPDSRVDVRKLRSGHLGKLVAIEGLVRKATDVRPKLVEAVFRCFRCPAKIVEIQEGLQFKEPLECYKEQNGCGRSGGSTKFTLMTEESSYVDTQKIEIQENPEGLRGGSQPERLTGYLEDDLAGTVSPGDRIVINGILRSVQKAQGNNKSTLFDINLEVHSVEFQEHEYEEVNISPEEEEMIKQEARSPDVFGKIIKSISPTIYGYDEVKESMALQLFGGSHKQLDDGTRVRGDIHILLVGDPGVAKCVTGDTDVMLASGVCTNIKNVVEQALVDFGSEEVDDGEFANIDVPIMTFSERGVIEPGRAVRAWKRTSPRKLLEFVTESGRKLTVTRTHLLFVQNGMWIAARKADQIYVGEELATATGQGEGGREDYGWRCGLVWDKVISKTEVKAPEPFVYDLEVETTHIFVANGILSHNSQLLRYMSELAPRGIYASGKSSSAAGLCVAGDTKIEVKGKLVEIGEFVESRIKTPTEVDKGVFKQEVGVNGLKTVSADGQPVTRPVSAVFRIDTPSFLVELKEESGRSISLTPETQVMSRIGQDPAWIRSSDVMADDEIMMVGPAGDHSMSDWSRVVEVERKVDGIPEHVYDLTVEDAHCFIGNGFVVHNTAAAVKDEFGDGRWTLEAGALVLADKGLACVDGEQLVVLKDGIARLKDVRPGNTVINYLDGWNEGKVRTTLDKGEKDCLKIKLFSGDELICTPDHKLLTEDGWMEASEIKEDSFLKIPTMEKIDFDMLFDDRIEVGFLHGFMLCDCYASINDHSRLSGFSASVKNNDRTEYIEKLLKDYCGAKLGRYKRSPQHVSIRGKAVDFGDTLSCYCSTLEVKGIVKSVIEADRGGYFDLSYRIGFLAGIISTDCCVSHHQGPNGIKHTIEIVLSREKYGKEWLERKQALVVSMLSSLGIMAVRRKNKLMITSCRSFNRVVDVIGPFVVGKNEPKLYHIEQRTKIQSDDDLLDREYHEWLASVKFNTSKTVSLGLHSRIWSAIKRNRVTETLMETLRPHWHEIASEGFREPNKKYLLNRVISVEDAGKRHVYDLVIEGEHNFLVNGGIVHNCIDELDKMTEQDRSSMHEAMESQRISVAKAGITATLQCRCSMLGAANPKYGRFDDNESLSDQINMPPALLSRFDLIFALTDKPKAETDTRIAEHIIMGHVRGEVRRHEDLSVLDDLGVDYKKIMEDTDKLKPVYDREFLRKYVAHSKRYVPVMSKEARKIIQEKYLSIRKLGEVQGASVPITARQLEAFIRLSEASARIRLSNVVTKEDAERAVRIVEFYLNKMARDSGSMDVDKVMTGFSKTDRNKISVVRTLIHSNSEPGKGVSFKTLLEHAPEKNLTEQELRDALKKLRNAGDIYEPSHDFYKLSSGD